MAEVKAEISREEEDRFEQEFARSFEKIRDKFDRTATGRLHITLVGSMNAEKERVMQELTGFRIRDIKPVSEGKNKIYELAEGVFVADTPGYNKKGTLEIPDLIPEETDLILFFIDAPAGINRDVKSAFQKISGAGKGIVAVIDKTDKIGGEALETLLRQAGEELGVVPVPVPDAPDAGMEELNERILELLEDPEDESKVLLYLKISQYKRKHVDKWIRKAAALAFAVGALPLPGSDIVPLTAIQLELALKIAWVFDIRPDKARTLDLIHSTLTGNTGKKMVWWAMETLERPGWKPDRKIKGFARAGISSLVAASLTFAFGWACYAYYKSGMTIDPDEITHMFRTAFEEFRDTRKKAERD